MHILRGLRLHKYKRTTVGVVAVQLFKVVYTVAATITAHHHTTDNTETALTSQQENTFDNFWTSTNEKRRKPTARATTEI